jgi:flagellin-like hook-associated protein FlgL
MNNKIALTASMRSNLLSLKNTQAMFSKTQDKLSTGYKVNSAIDNPSSYFTAQALNSRANDLSTLLDGIGQAISTLEVADQGITTLQSFVEQAKTVANNARDTQNVASNTTTMQKFDTDRLRTLTLDQQMTTLTNTDELVIRSGKSTELVGTKTVSADTQASAAFSNTAVTAPVIGTAGTGGSGSLKVGNEEFILDFNTAVTANTMKEYTQFAAGDRLKIVDSSTLTQTVVEDSNGKRHVINLTGVIDPASNPAAAATADVLREGTEITCTAADMITTTVSELGSTAQTSSFTAASWTVTKSGLGASGANVKTQTYLQFKGGQTVGQVLERMEYFIGKDKISLSFEDGNLAVRSMNTASIEATGTGTGDFAQAFGLDVGTTITVDPTAETAEALRQKIDAIDGINADFDETGHITIKNMNGDDMVMSGKLAELLGVNGAVTNGSNERDSYAKQFNAMLSQMDQLVQDSSYKGVNLLNGDSLTVNFNESRTSSVELKGVTFDSNGLGLTKAANRWIDNASIDTSLNQIIKATSLLRAQSSEFGQNLSTVQIREDFTQNMINNLQSGADKLTLADMNEEAANMLALQTRQQLGLNSLSMASQASQSVLSLF